MAIAVGVHTKFTSTGTQNGTSSALTTQASGSIIILGGIWDFSDAIDGTTPVQDSKSNTWTQVQTELTWGSGTGKLRAYYCQNATGGSSHTFTWNFTSITTLTFFITEITGALTSGALDSNPAAAVDTASPFASPLTGVLAQAAECVYTLFASNSGSNAAISEGSGNSFTIQDQEQNGGSFWCGAAATKITAATTSIGASFTQTGCTSGGHQILSIKEGSGVVGHPASRRFGGIYGGGSVFGREGGQVFRQRHGVFAPVNRKIIIPQLRAA